MIVARLLGTLCGLLCLLARGVVRLPTLSRVLGVAFALAVAHLPANECPKHKSGYKRRYKITQPNRDHKRAGAIGKLELPC